MIDDSPPLRRGGGGRGIKGEEVGITKINQI